MLHPLRVDPTDGREGLVLGELGPWLRLRPPQLRLEGAQATLQAQGPGRPETGVDGLVVHHAVGQGLSVRRHWRHRGLPPGAVATFWELHQGAEGTQEVAELWPWEAEWAPGASCMLSPPKGPGPWWWPGLGPEGGVALAWLGLGPAPSWEGDGEGPWRARWRPSSPLVLGPGALAWGPTLLAWPAASQEGLLATWKGVQARAQELGLA